MCDWAPQLRSPAGGPTPTCGAPEGGRWRSSIAGLSRVRVPYSTCRMEGIGSDPRWNSTVWSWTKAFADSHLRSARIACLIRKNYCNSFPVLCGGSRREKRPQVSSHNGWRTGPKGNSGTGKLAKDRGNSEATRPLLRGGTKAIWFLRSCYSTGMILKSR